MAQPLRIDPVTPEEEQQIASMFANGETKYSPAMPIPRTFDIQERIEQLRSLLDSKDPYYHHEHDANVKALIKLYEEGKVDL
ncbi:hypothetical protein DV736_g6584, partial [Chaetothyriales sp. CBS 134916]